jgi:hypothetical protein
LAFISAAAIEDTISRYAINNLVTDLKLNGIWTKLQAVYPMAGSSASSQKWNLKDPRDLDAAFRLAFFGGWTHSSTGATPNGTNGYASTFFTPSTSLTVNSTHLSVYLNTNNAPPYADPIEIGSFNGVTQSILLQQGIAATLATRNLGDVVSGSQTGRMGFGITSKTSSTVTTLYKDGVLVASGNSGGSLPTYPTWIGNMNYIGSGLPTGWTNNSIAFSSIGEGLTAEESLTYTSIVQRYQSALSRAAVAVPTVQDINAQNFLVAAGITDSTQAQAVQNLVTELKYNSLWTKMATIFPMVGGSATTHSFNLKNPTRFNLSFVGGWTQSSTGAKPNGTNGRANSGYLMSDFTVNDTHLSYYSRTDVAPGVGQSGFPCEIGADATISGNYTELNLMIQSQTGTNLYSRQYADPAQGVLNGQVFVNNPDSLGMYIGSRTNSTTHKAYKNGSQIGTTNTVTNTFTLASSQQLSIGSDNANSWSTRECAFSSMGLGLSDTEAANLTTVVQAYQTALSRQV